jgi:hypothetical protein
LQQNFISENWKISVGNQSFGCRIVISSFMARKVKNTIENCTIWGYGMIRQKSTISLFSYFLPAAISKVESWYIFFWS